MSKWFGENWGAPVCDPEDHIPTPVGDPCVNCEEAIEAGDQGVVFDLPYHIECFTRAISGGLNHQRGLCTCCGGTLPPDPPGLTKRQAAVAAEMYWLLTRWGTRP